ncbi:NAD-dependent epimerase/dehydratase family protein [Leucobacter celer]|uniref:NAD-dependent epimerase/dehydratase family protein n=1 Tax=Leucobacter celer TaxID=668625 RepID=UPI0006A7A8E8|nr:NAD-dependent epimerase/dehydratase family protein [Leucobacter celer]
MVNILVTGGAGFLGVAMATAFVERGHTVASFDVQLHAKLEALGVEQHVGSITDRAALDGVFEAARPEVVVHAAAVVGVAASINGIAQSVEVNVLGSVHLFEAALAAGVRRVIDISSEETYGDFSADPISEDDPALPITPYGITKHAVERLGNYFADQRGLPYHALRFCWVYGPDFPRARIPQSWIDDALAGRSSVEPHGAEQLIDFTYIDDVVDGLVLAVEADELRHRAYHIASGAEIPFSRVAEAIRAECPQWNLEMGDGLLEVAPGLRAARKGALDIGRARRDLGYEPRVSIDEGMRKTLEWYRKQRGS